MPPLRIGVNTLYLIPGGVGGTEIYLRELLAALAELDQVNEYLIFTNLETQSDLVPKQAYFRWFDLPFWQFLLWAAAHRSDRLIAVSEATRADLHRYYRIAKEGVTVVH